MTESYIATPPDKCTWAEVEKGEIQTKEGEAETGINTGDHAYLSGALSLHFSESQCI